MAETREQMEQLERLNELRDTVAENLVQLSEQIKKIMPIKERAISAGGGAGVEGLKSKNILEEIDKGLDKGIGETRELLEEIKGLKEGEKIIYDR